MPSSSFTNNDQVHLDASEKDKQVFITSENEDRFYVPMPEAVRRIQIGESRHAWNDELNAMLVAVHQWACHTKARDCIKECYAAPCDGTITIYVVPATGRFDFNLANQITDLDLRLARDFQAVPTEIIQIPGDTDDCLMQFVDTRIAISLSRGE